MELRPSLKMGKSKCAKSPISYLTTAPPEFETFKLLLMAVALPYRGSNTKNLLVKVFFVVFYTTYFNSILF